ncbi:hypothetical protein GC197_18485 [bacterium]|nr:hypothetical protein [bacterium]
MARFLKALQGLQPLEPGENRQEESAAQPPEKTPPVQQDREQTKTIPKGAVAPQQTIVLDRDSQNEEAAPKEVPQPAPPVERKPDPQVEQQNELIKKLTQQLAVALKQRDTVAQEVQQVRESLLSRDKRHDEEIVKLRDKLDSHQESSHAIESELRSIESKLRDQLNQQQQFSQKLTLVEKQFNEQKHRAAEQMLRSASPPEAPKPGPLLPKSDRQSPSQKQFPTTEPIRLAMAEVGDQDTALQYAELSQQILGPVDFTALHESQVIFIANCIPGHSSGPLVLRMASWLSQQPCDVMMIDGAMRERWLTETFGLRASTGLFETVRRETYRQDGTYRDPNTGIALIPSGKSSFVLTTSEQDLSSLRDQLREILKSFPVVLIAGEGPDMSASWLMAKVATRTYLQADLGYVSPEEVQAAVECYRQVGIEPAGIIGARLDY